MDNPTIKDQLRRLLERLDAEDGAQAARSSDGGGAGCGCGGAARAVTADSPIGADGAPMVRLFQRLATAFRPVLAAEPDEHSRQVADALILSAAALGRLAVDLRVAADEESGARRTFFAALAPLVDAAAHPPRAAASALLQGSRVAPPLDADRSFGLICHDLSALLLAAPGARGDGPFPVYADGVAEVGGVLADLLAALAESPPTKATALDVSEAYQRCREITGATIGQIARCLFFGLTAAVPRPANTCPPNCPSQGCTTYCYDEYSNPVGCGAWSYKKGDGWSITCTWTIDAVVKYVCCCYPDWWHRFWAYGACTDCTATTTTTGTRTGTYTWTSATRTQPAAPPSVFHIETC